MRPTKALLVSFSVLAFAGAAHAQHNSQQQASEQSKPGFSQLDKDGDRKLSRSEAAADPNAKSSFEELDQNKDQQLSQQEFQRAQQTSQQQAKQGQQQGQMRTSELIGSKVMDKQGKELGEINDVVLDLQGGKVHAAVLEFGGILGVGEKNYAFPISQLQPAKGRNQFTMNIDKQKLENAEGFAKSEWPAMDDEYWGRVGGQASAGATKSQGKKESPAQKQKMTLVRASELEGKNVTDKQGQEVGDIKDVVVDMKSGQLRNVVIDVQDGGEARVPAKSIAKGTGDQFLLSGMSAEQLKKQAQQSGKQSRSQRPGESQSQGGASTGASQPQKSGSTR